MMTTSAHRSVAAVLLAGLAACSASGPEFAETISFNGQTLAKGPSWNRGNMSGIVYIPPGASMPTAPLQVGAIVSSVHKTGADLHTWIRGQLKTAAHFHESNAPEESCRIARDGGRSYVALEVCKTGVARAACVEADEALDSAAIDTCMGTHDACFEDICDRRWLARREALDLLVAEVLTKR
jgi:hypothetical protein